MLGMTLATNWLLPTHPNSKLLYREGDVDMPIDRDLLQQISAQVKPAGDTGGVGELVRSIHRAPSLREWVTMESAALAPVPVKRGKNWGIISLLAVPTKSEDNSEAWFAPWGAAAKSSQFFKISERGNRVE